MNEVLGSIHITELFNFVFLWPNPKYIELCQGIKMLILTKKE